MTAAPPEHRSPAKAGGQSLHEDSLTTTGPLPSQGNGLRSWKYCVFALNLGALSSLGMAPLEWWPIAMIALAAFIWLLQASARPGFALGWWFGFGYFLVGLNWLPTSFGYQAKMPAFLGWVALALLAGVLAVYPALAAWVTKRIAGNRLLPLILALAGSWALSEWLRATLFTGFAWNPLAELALPMHYAYPARILGTYGLSALIILLVGALLLLTYRQWREALYLSVVLLMLTVAGSLSSRLSGGVNTTLVQPNIGQNQKWEGDAVDTNFNKLASLSSPKDNKPRLLLWTEAAFPDYIEDGYPDGYYRIPPSMQRQRITALLGPKDLILTGGLKLEFDGKGEVSGARNSAFVVNAQGQILGRYDKSHLVPFGEYLPLRFILEPLGVSRLVPGSVDFIPGSGPQTIELPDFGKVGFLICYEMIFSGHVVDKNNRPDFLFSPSNDAWFGGWGAPQHHAQARLRAIEEGLPIARVTPTGISSIIDAFGETIVQIPQDEAGRVDHYVPGPVRPTLFSLFGNVIPLLFGLILVFTAIVLARRQQFR